MTPSAARLWDHADVTPKGPLAAFLALSLVAAAGCASSGRRASQATVTSPRATSTVAGTSGSGAITGSATTTSAPPACSNTSVIHTWPLRQRVMRLVVAPSLNFNLPQLGSVLAAGVGGVLFLGSGPPPSNLAKLIAVAQASPVGGVPVLTMADEEGGGIQRLNGLVVSFAWPRQLAAGESTAKVASLARTVGTQLRAAGINMDLAPVLDVDGGAGPNNQNPDGERSFSAVPAVASSYGVAFLQGLAAGGELSTVKHFPGLGGSTGNSDAGAAHTLPFATLQSQAYPPFRAAIVAGAPAVMVANDTVPGLTTAPASLSAAVIQGQLRGALGFRGAVVTDSLSAGAISAAGFTVPAASVAAVEAGADLVLFGSTLTPSQINALAPSQVLVTVNNIANALVDAVGRGALAETTVDEAVTQVVALSGVNLCAHHGA